MRHIDLAGVVHHAAIARGSATRLCGFNTMLGHAGHTFSEFLNRLRLQTACRELEESERGILEIALASGFSQVSFFNRIFRREHQCNPSEYRARQRNKKREEREKPGPGE